MSKYKFLKRIVHIPLGLILFGVFMLTQPIFLVILFFLCEDWEEFKKVWKVNTTTLFNLLTQQR